MVEYASSIRDSYLAKNSSCSSERLLTWHNRSPQRPNTRPRLCFQNWETSALLRDCWSSYAWPCAKAVDEPWQHLGGVQPQVEPVRSLCRLCIRQNNPTYPTDEATCTKGIGGLVCLQGCGKQPCPSDGPNSQNKAEDLLEEMAHHNELISSMARRRVITSGGVMTVLLRLPRVTPGSSSWATTMVTSAESKSPTPRVRTPENGPSSSTNIFLEASRVQKFALTRPLLM